MSENRSFDCRNCPKNHDEAKGDFCNAWWETVHTNIQTGEVKVNASCGFKQLPMYLIEVIKAANRPAAAIESTRNEMVRGFAALASSQFAEIIRQRVEATDEDQPRLGTAATPAGNGAEPAGEADTARPLDG